MHHRRAYLVRLIPVNVKLRQPSCCQLTAWAPNSRRVASTANPSLGAPAWRILRRLF